MAALIPVLAPIAAPIIEDLITKLVEKIFPKGTGTTKLPVATEILGAIQNGLATVGAVPTVGPATTTAALTSKIQSSVDKLKQQGQLNGAATVIDPVAVAAVIPATGLPSDAVAAFATLLKALGR